MCRVGGCLAWLLPLYALWAASLGCRACKSCTARLIVFLGYRVRALRRGARAHAQKRRSLDRTHSAEWLAEEAREQDRDQTTPALWAWFIERCRMNVHVALCMSPIGEGLRTRLRQFPSLINCTTIDWFDKWPTEALQAVAYHALGQLPDVPKKTLDGVVSVCISAQQSVIELSERFHAELRRVNYVTPTLYLNLLALLAKMLQEKRKEVGVSPHLARTSRASRPHLARHLSPLACQIPTRSHLTPGARRAGGGSWSRA